MGCLGNLRGQRGVHPVPDRRDGPRVIGLRLGRQRVGRLAQLLRIDGDVGGHSRHLAELLGIEREGLGHYLLPGASCSPSRYGSKPSVVSGLSPPWEMYCIRIRLTALDPAT